MHAINIKQELILIPRSISMLLRVPNRPPAPPYPDEPQHICLSEAGDSWQDQVCGCTMQHSYWAAVQSSPKSTKTFEWMEWTTINSAKFTTNLLSSLERSTISRTRACMDSTAQVNHSWHTDILHKTSRGTHTYTRTMFAAKH